MTDYPEYPTLKDLQDSIEYAIEQGGNDNYLLNDHGYPWLWGYYLHVVKAQKGVVILAQTHDQLFAALRGDPQPTADKLPKYNIDWDIRSDVSGNFAVYKKKDGEKLTMMGTFDFNTPEEGAKLWLEQIMERVPRGLWTSWEEKQAIDAEIKKEFQEFFDKHCGDEGDCPLRPTCEVKWPGGFGLQGCRVKELAEGAEGGYKQHMATPENLKVATAIATEIREIL
jgi:hypothetical protein